MGTLPIKYHRYITPTLLFYFEVAKLGHLNHLNVKEVNEILTNNTGYYKEVFDMYNYLMLVMFAIEQNRDQDKHRRHVQKTPEVLSRELLSDLTTSIMDNPNKDKGIITVEVTEEDIKRMNEDRKHSRKKRNPTPSTTSTKSTAK